MTGNLWQRYFIRYFFKVFFLFLIGFYALYILIDYASHASGSHHNHIRFAWSELSFYYVLEWIKRVDILVPFAVLIASITTLTQLQRNNELISLLVSGIGIRTLLRPFLLLGLLFTCLLYANTEWLVPKALAKMTQINQRYDGLEESVKMPSVHKVSLDDDSILLFQQFDEEKNQLFDLYWVRSLNDLYRIKFLSLETDPPQGKWVDHLTRTEEGRLLVTESFSSTKLSALHIQKESLHDVTTPPEEWPLSALWKRSQYPRVALKGKETYLLSTFIHKMLLPWLSLLVVVAVAPFCINFERSRSTFLTFSCAIFALLAFYLFLDASAFLGKKQILSPYLTLCFPFFLSSAFFSWKYFQLR